ncbi:MAG: hypothetical protein ACKVOQ_11770 [Cyclobacteriaceae bacterium]
MNEQQDIRIFMDWRNCIMRIYFFLLVLILVSCEQYKDNRATRLTFDFLDSIKNFTGDSLVFKLTKDEVDRLNFRPVDSLFYLTYLTKGNNFNGFNFDHSKIGGPTCYQYYYGAVRNRISGYSQLLVLQSYTFNDQVNDLFLLTFDKRDSLESTLPVASLIFQAEIEPIFSSIMTPDNRIIKSEVTINHIPEEVKTDSTSTQPRIATELLLCTDSVTRQFRFADGKYVLTKRDSVKSCVWEKRE